ncbi:hypothetical protein [Stieleria varia]|uniref:Secreted protein n=1 Tax=Stieleria varia TaxID=2528005 RepID=A0A5C6A1X4_9BACT|nr:hypothetical protein [Stieleria varia]TWT93340.1 hypothetical protein Pla52n_60000 [Stieleria varia]
MTRFCFALLLLAACVSVGCGPDNSVTVSPVDDSAIHSEETMAEMEAEYAAQQRSE